MKKEIVYTAQAEKFVSSLPQKAKSNLDRALCTLSEQGFLHAPTAEKVEGYKGLFEIRIKDASGQYRVFYIYAQSDVVILLNGFQKKSQKTPIAELNKALKLMREYGYED